MASARAAHGIPELPVETLTLAFGASPEPRFMFLLGAGASVGAGIPTASQLIWECKRNLVCAMENLHPEALKDLSLESNRIRIQAVLDAKARFPAIGSDSEYSHYLSATYPSPVDRKAYLAQKASAGTPTLGHKCLAALIDADRTDYIWTTNFDDVIERGQPRRRLLVISPESSHRIGELRSDVKAARLLKLHGDYRYDTLQNTAEEVRRLDDDLRQLLINESRRLGLIVVGYSGRDQSVMDTLEAASGDPRSFPNGLYWCLRDEERPNPRVHALFEQLAATSRDAGNVGIVRISEFDDVMYRLFLASGLADEQVKAAAAEGSGIVGFQIERDANLTPRRAGSLLLLNALSITEWPRSYLAFDARWEPDAHPWTETRERIAGKEMIAYPFAGRLYALGDRAEIEEAFEGRVASPIDLVSHEVLQQAYHGAAEDIRRHFVRQILSQGFAGIPNLSQVRRQSFMWLDLPAAPASSPLTQILRPRKGRSEYWINEGFRFDIESMWDRLSLAIMSQP